MIIYYFIIVLLLSFNVSAGNSPAGRNVNWPGFRGTYGPFLIHGVKRILNGKYQSPGLRIPAP